MKVSGVRVLQQVVVCDRSPLVTDVLVRGLQLRGVAARGTRWDEPAPAPAAVVLLDADPPHEDVLATAAALCPDPSTIVLLSRSTGPATAELARALGAVGRLSRGHSLEELSSAVRLVASGRPLPLAVPDARDVALDALDSLTAREREVLVLLATGARNDAVAHRLRISPHTVRTHVQNVLAKLGVDNRLAAAAVARRSGLVVAGAAP